MNTKFTNPTLDVLRKPRSRRLPRPAARRGSLRTGARVAQVPHGWTVVPTNPFAVPGTAAGFLDVRKRASANGGVAGPVITVAVPAYNGGTGPIVYDLNLIVTHTSLMNDNAYSGFRLQYVPALAAAFAAHNLQGGSNAGISTAVPGQRLVTGNAVPGMADSLQGQVYNQLVAGKKNLLLIDGPTNELSNRVNYGSDLSDQATTNTGITATQAATQTMDALHAMLQQIRAYCTANNIDLIIVVGSILPRQQPAVPQPLFEQARLLYNQLLTDALANKTALFDARAWCGEQYKATTPGPKYLRTTTYYLNDGVHLSPAGRDDIFVPAFVDATLYALAKIAQPGPVTSPQARNYTAAYVAALQAAGYSPTSTEQAALTQLESALRGGSLLGDGDTLNQRLLTAYPFLGTTAAAQGLNFVDPSRFALTFASGASFDADGLATAGTVARTGIDAAVFLDESSNHLAFYLRQDIASNSPELGTPTSGGSFFGLWARCAPLGNTLVYNNGGDNLIQAAVPAAKGWTLGTRTASTVVAGYRNAAVAGTDNKPTNGYPGGITQLQGTNTFAWASIGMGLSSADNTAYYNAVQAFVTALGRNV